jgi:hypothetical protein
MIVFRTLVVLVLFSASTAYSQIPRGLTAYGNFTFKPGLYGISGASPVMNSTSSRFGGLLSFNATIVGSNSFSQVHTDIVHAGLLSLPFGGIDYIPRVFSTQLEGLDRAALPSTQKGPANNLVFTKPTIMAVTQSFDVSGGAMLGYHLGWEGVNSFLVNKDRITVGQDGALNLTYINLGPVLAFQDDAIRVEAKYGLLLAPAIEKTGKEFNLSADYYISDNSESVAVALGVYLNTVRISTNEKRPNVQDFSFTSFGFKLGLLYPSLFNLIQVD